MSDLKRELSFLPSQLHSYVENKIERIWGLESKSRELREDLRSIFENYKIDLRPDMINLVNTR